MRNLQITLKLVMSILKKYIGVGILIFPIALYLLIKDRVIEFQNINDYVSSYILLLSITIGSIILLSNFKIIPSKWIIKLVDDIPDKFPFGRDLKRYMLSLIDKHYKISVLLRTLDDKNEEWVLNQIDAYNKIANEGHSVKNTNIEYIFIQDKDNAIVDYIDKLETSKYEYIIITSLSSIFRQSIEARENLSSKKKKSIKIMGALSSISSDIQDIIDEDDNIIRIFPPDYDEAKTAMEFLMSKIKSSICVTNGCPSHKRVANIIIIHNGTYGEAVRKQAEIAYKKELKKFYHYTHPSIESIQIQEAINFYALDYKSNGELLYENLDIAETNEFFNKWEDEMNYFYIIGYEPNISHMLNTLNEKISHLSLEKCILFCGTLSMTSWRNAVKNKLEKSKALKDTLDTSYYLQLQTYLSTTQNHTEELLLKLTTATSEGKLLPVDLEKVIQNILPHKDRDQIKDYLKNYWKREENYIGVFSKLSMRIAKHSIENEVSLLKSKSTILHNYRKGKAIEILMSGDSINHYKCVPLKDN